MPALFSPPVDLIEELMFRCWARKNYLPPELRERDWHPIILEEMSRRDRELAENSFHTVRHDPPATPRYVPLIPVVTHYVHPAQLDIREPYILSADQVAGNLSTDSIYTGGIYHFEI